MDVTKIYQSSDMVRTLEPDELALATRILRDNMDVTSKDSLLVVTDPAMVTQEGALWFEAGKALAGRVHMVVFEGMSQHAQEPPSVVTLMMSKSSVVMLQTSYSLSHTAARKLATSKGARIASLPTARHDLLMRTLSTDFDALGTLSTKIADSLTTANQARVTTPLGTDITFALTDRAGIDDTGFYTRRGDFGNLPAGEAFVAPVEGMSNGVFVVDGSFAEVQLDAPITITIQDGIATSITGGKAADALKQQLEAVGNPLAYSIAELGIGTNKAADPTGELIEAEKAYGTVHIALGNNATIGGTTSVPFHSDGVLLMPTLWLDDDLVIQDGVFVDR